MTTALEDPLWTGLSQQRRDKLLEKHRDTNVADFNWWEGVYEQCIEHLKELGIETAADRMWFSGFWCQGDGASFAGSVHNWAKFLDHAKVTDAAMRRFIIGEPEDNALNFEAVRRDARYCHENTVACSFTDWPENHFDEETDPVRFYAREALLKELDHLESKFAELFYDQMRELYSALEAEHDYLTSDEVVVEYILEHCPEDLVEDEEEEFSAS